MSPIGSISWIVNAACSVFKSVFIVLSPSSALFSGLNSFIIVCLLVFKLIRTFGINVPFVYSNAIMLKY